MAENAENRGNRPAEPCVPTHRIAGHSAPPRMLSTLRSSSGDCLKALSAVARAQGHPAGVRRRAVPARHRPGAARVCPRDLGRPVHCLHVPAVQGARPRGIGALSRLNTKPQIIKHIAILAVLSCGLAGVRAVLLAPRLHSASTPAAAILAGLLSSLLGAFQGAGAESTATSEPLLAAHRHLWLSVTSPGTWDAL